MLLKSLSRKAPTFDQLYDYFLRDPIVPTMTFNLYGQSREEILDEFHTHDDMLLNKSASYNRLYHEIFSLGKIEGISEKDIFIIFSDILQKYLSLRAPTALCFVALHLDDNRNLHAHLMISVAGIDNPELRICLSKKEFNNIQRTVERYIQQQYPHLNQPTLYNRSEKSLHPSDKEQKVIARTGTSKRQKLIHLLEDFLNYSLSQEEMKQELGEIGISMYTKGKYIGVQDSTGRNYRLKTLQADFQERFEALPGTFELTLSKTSTAPQRPLSKQKIVTEKQQSQSIPQPQSKKKKKRERKEKKMSQKTATKETDEGVFDRLFDIFLNVPSQKVANKTVEFMNEAIPSEYDNPPVYPEAESHINSLYKSFTKKYQLNDTVIDFKTGFRQANISFFKELDSLEEMEQAAKDKQQRLDEYWRTVDSRLDSWERYEEKTNMEKYWNEMQKRVEAFAKKQEQKQDKGLER